MKYLLLFIIFFLKIITLAAQKGDEKLLKQATSFVARKDYQKAADLLEKVSENTKSEDRFLQLSSAVYDSLNDYKQALAAYESLLQKTASDAVVERINVLRQAQALSDEAERQRLEKMKNCTKCNGTGYFAETVVCNKCDGYKIVRKECQRCHGKGRIICISCDGSGSVYSEPLKMRVTCSRCSGQGSQECSNMCNRGIVEVECTKCMSTGTITQKTKCDLH